MKICVLGAGLLGVCSAWYLAKDGHEVTVIDRQPAAGMETSFANGAQIATSYAIPWANPHTPLQALKWFGQSDAPLLWRPSANCDQWLWGLRFLRECFPARMHKNLQNILRLALFSQQEFHVLQEECHIDCDWQGRGILHFYTNNIDWDYAIQATKLLNQYGCTRQVVSAQRVLEIEPALTCATIDIIGGTFTPQDGSGDAHRFTQALAKCCEHMGVVFHYASEVSGLRCAANKVLAVEVINPNQSVFDCDAAVVSLGSYSAQFLRPYLRRYKIALPIYPVKGYSLTIPLQQDAIAPLTSLTDDAFKLVYSRLGNRLRVAGTAEWTGFDKTTSHQRLAPLMKRVGQLFPSLRNQEEWLSWSGLRPSTPSNVPIIGLAGMENLYVNSGHGTLGWTLACGSGKLLSELIHKIPPQIDPSPYACI